MSLQMQAISHVLGSVHTMPSPIVSGPPLEPGTHLFELALARPPRDADTLALGLTRAGFSRIILDASDAETVSESEWGSSGQTGANVFRTPPYRVRAIGTVERTLLPTDGPELAWLFAETIGIDVYAEIEGRAALEPFELRRGGLYELRFVSRMRSERKEGSRAAVLRSLSELMRFSVLKLACLKKDMRLPGRPNASDALWYAVALWQGPDSTLSIEDPFFFQDVREICSPEETADASATEEG